MELLERWHPPHVGQAWYEIGEIEKRRGDFAAADAAFGHAIEYGKDPQPGLAMLRLAQGDAAVASALLRVGVAGARLAAERLSGIVAVFETVILQARAATSLTHVALAEGANADALTAARAAVNLWRDAGAPYEPAQTQCLVAEAALRIGDRRVAIVEVDAAIAAFANLGAACDLEAAQTLRIRLGSTTIGRPVRRTFMFTDIVDSTRLVAEMGDEAWSRVLHAHDLTIRDLLAKHQGIEVKQRGGGDGFFVVFTSPTDAIGCAVAIQRSLADQRDAAHDVPQIRNGVHEADALMSRNDFAGLGVHEAARIGAHAHAGSILASAITAVAFKGLNDRLAVQEIEWRTTPEPASPADNHL